MRSKGRVTYFNLNLNLIRGIVKLRGSSSMVVTMTLYWLIRTTRTRELDGNRKAFKFLVMRQMSFTFKMSS